MKLADLYVEVRQTGLGKINAQLTSFHSRLQKTSMVMGKMAATARRAFLISGAAIAGAVYAYAKFERQVAMVSTMLDEGSMKHLPQYQKALKNMSVEFGESTATLAKGLYDILSASVAPEKALDVLRVASRAAAAGFTSTANSADVITTVLNAYQISADDAAIVSDKLFATVKRGKLTFEELASSLGMVAATAATTGLSLDELLATIATVTRAGVNAHQAMTAVVGVLRAFLKPTEDGAKLAKQLGFELSTAALRAKGLVKIFQELNGLSAEQVAKLFPNIRGIKAVAAAMQDAEGHAYDLSIMQNAAGMTSEAFGKATNTLSHHLKQLKSQLGLVAVEFGEAFVPAIKVVIKFLEKLLDLLSVLPKWAKQLVLIVPAVSLLVLGLHKMVLGLKLVAAVMVKATAATVTATTANVAYTTSAIAASIAQRNMMLGVGPGAAAMAGKGFVAGGAAAVTGGAVPGMATYGAASAGGLAAGAGGAGIMSTVAGPVGIAAIIAVIVAKFAESQSAKWSAERIAELQKMGQAAAATNEKIRSLKEEFSTLFGTGREAGGAGGSEMIVEALQKRGEAIRAEIQKWADFGGIRGGGTTDLLGYRAALGALVDNNVVLAQIINKKREELNQNHKLIEQEKKRLELLKKQEEAVRLASIARTALLVSHKKMGGLGIQLAGARGDTRGAARLGADRDYFKAQEELLKRVRKLQTAGELKVSRQVWDDESKMLGEIRWAKLQEIERDRKDQLNRFVLSGVGLQKWEIQSRVAGAMKLAETPEEKAAVTRVGKELMKKFWESLGIGMGQKLQAQGMLNWAANLQKERERAQEEESKGPSAGRWTGLTDIYKNLQSALLKDNTQMKQLEVQKEMREELKKIAENVAIGMVLI